MDLRGTKIKNTYGNLLTIGDVAGSNQTGSLYNGEGELITSLFIEGSITASSMVISTASISGDLRVEGTLTAQEFVTEYVSSSVIYESGSTKFGDTYDDIHSFTGSLQVSGSTVLNSTLSVSQTSSFQSDVSISGSLTVSGSTELSGSLGLNLAESGSIFEVGQGSDIIFDIDEFEMTGSMSVSGSFNIDGESTFTKNATFNQNLTVQGDITAERFFTEYVTSSVIYESGSTKFGDTYDDIHSFTGSLQVSGSSIIYGTSSVNGTLGITGSLDVTGSVNYSLADSGSFVVENSSDIVFDVDQFTMTGSMIVSGSTELIGTSVITGSLLGSVVNLSVVSNTASMDLSTSNFFELTLPSSTTTHLTSTNIKRGQSINLLIIQPSTSGSLEYSNEFKFAGGVPYTVSATASVQDLLGFVSFDGSTLLGSSLKNMS